MCHSSLPDPRSIIHASSFDRVVRALCWFPFSAMAVGLVSNEPDIPDEEARAEVDVLNSRLEKTTQLTKKIQACLGRLDATGKAVHEVTGPLNGETRRLQTLGKSQASACTFVLPVLTLLRH